MKNTIGKIVKAGKHTFDRLDAKINFSLPQNLISYSGITGKKNDKDLQLTHDNFRLQIGKMEKNNETIYTKEILLPAFEYIFKKLPQNEKAIIQLRPDLARFLLNEDQKEKGDQILSFEEEKQQIIKLIKKYFRKDIKKIEIINVSDKYPEIFSLLKEVGKDGLGFVSSPLDSHNFSPLSLVKYLYQKAQNNPKLMQLFYATKPAEQRKEDKLPVGHNNSDYYSLVEVGIRLYEVVSGISIQGGIDRQSKYDKIIGGILQWKDVDTFKIKDYPELQELHLLCKEINPEVVFDKLWISTKEVRDVAEKQKSLSKMKTITLLSSVALFSILGGGITGYMVSQNKSKKDKQELESRILKESLNATDISFYGTHVEYKPGENIQEKEKYLNDIANHMYNFFSEVYGSSNNVEIVKSLIKNELLKIHTTYVSAEGQVEQARNIERFYHLPIDWSLMYIEDFVVNEFVPNNEVVLNQLDLNPIPYNSFLPYKQDLNYTNSLEGNIFCSFDSALGDVLSDNTTGLQLKYDSQVKNIPSLKRMLDREYIGSYYDYHHYKSYHFIKVKTNTGKDIILASEGSYTFDESESQIFSLDKAKEAIQKIQSYRKYNM